MPIVQLVRASDCGSECRGFESHWAPKRRKPEVFSQTSGFFFIDIAPDFGAAASLFSRVMKIAPELRANSSELKNFIGVR